LRRIFFFFANLSFYLVMTLFMQTSLHTPPLQAGLVFVPLTLAFMVASRHSGVRAKFRGARVLVEGRGVQIAGLAAVMTTVASLETLSIPLLALLLIVVGYGPGIGGGAAVERTALEGTRRQRRLGIGTIQYNRADRQRDRRGRHRHRFLCSSIGAIAANGTFRRTRVACHVDCNVCGFPGRDASLITGLGCLRDRQSPSPCAQTAMTTASFV
jgi:hypothetical protein